MAELSCIREEACPKRIRSFSEKNREREREKKHCTLRAKERKFELASRENGEEVRISLVCVARIFVGSLTHWLARNLDNTSGDADLYTQY